MVGIPSCMARIMGNALRLRRSLMAAICCSLAIASGNPAAWAGVLVVETSRVYRRGAEITTTTLRVEPQRLSLDRIGPDGHETILFEAAPLTLRIVNYEGKFYRDLGEQSVQALHQGLEETRAAVRRRADEELRSLSPEQRKQMRVSVEARLSTSSTSPHVALPSLPTYTKVWSGEQAGPWRCDRYEGRVDGERVWDACVVPWARTGLAPEESTLLLSAIETLENLYLLGGFSLGHMRSTKDAKKDGYPGIPVQRVRLQADRPAEVFEVQELERQEFTDEDFAVPTGYERRAVLMMRSQQPSREGNGP